MRTGTVVAAQWPCGAGGAPSSAPTILCRASAAYGPHEATNAAAMAAISSVTRSSGSRSCGTATGPECIRERICDIYDRHVTESFAVASLAFYEAWLSAGIEFDASHWPFCSSIDRVPFFFFKDTTDDYRQVFFHLQRFL